MARPTPSTCYGVRVDTGVYDGGEIPMFYDSMIAKLIVHGRDRDDAIAQMREALNGFVIRGICSNIPFQAALLAHPEVRRRRLQHRLHRRALRQGLPRRGRAARRPGFPGGAGRLRAPPLRCSARPASAASCDGHGVKVGERVRRGHAGRAGQAPAHSRCRSPTSMAQTGSSAVAVGGRRYEIDSNWHAGQRARRRHRQRPALHGAGRARRGQESAGAARRRTTARRSRRWCCRRARRELLKLMPYKAPPDLSKFLLSPMPGLLVEVAVQPGQQVQAGEKLAVIEAMKMENVLFAAAGRRGRQDAGRARARSLAVDQPIMEFAVTHATTRPFQVLGHPADRHRRP